MEASSQSSTDASLTESEQRRVDAFVRITRLERGIRAFIETELSRVDGPQWHRALPGDVREKVEAGGIEATDFPDLKKILGSAWRKFGESVSEVRKDHLLNFLEALETVRNDIAHSRDVSAEGLSMVGATYYVARPLLAAGTSMQFGLPQTPHTQVVLDRIKTALKYRECVEQPDLDSLRRLGDFAGVCSVLDDYERLRLRPGRSPALLDQLHDRAMREIDSAQVRLEA